MSNSEWVDVHEEKLPDGSEYSIRLWHWRGSPECPAISQCVLFQSEGSEPYMYGSSLSLSADEARRMADRLNVAAKVLDEFGAAKR